MDIILSSILILDIMVIGANFISIFLIEKKLRRLTKEEPNNVTGYATEFYKLSYLIPFNVTMTLINFLYLILA